jgi:hypothetical protein
LALGVEVAHGGILSVMIDVANTKIAFGSASVSHLIMI